MSPLISILSGATVKSLCNSYNSFEYSRSTFKKQPFKLLLVYFSQTQTL